MSSTRKIRPHGPKLPVFRPDWPHQSQSDLQKTKIQLGDHRTLSWETTFQASFPPRKRDSSTQSIDTIALQKSHWKPGNFPSEQESEYIAEYKEHPLGQRPPKPDMTYLQDTHYNLGSDEATPQRNLMPDYTGLRETVPSFKAKLQGTHFNLKDPDAPRALSTYTRDYVPHLGFKPIHSECEFQTGTGMRDCFRSMGAYDIPNSSYDDTFIDYHVGKPESVNASTTIEGDQVNYNQSITNKWRKTNWSVGGTPDEVNSTHRADYVPHPVSAVDPGLARQKKLNLSKDSFPNPGYPLVKTSTTHDAIRAYPGARPATPAENTVATSHQCFKDFSNDGKTVYQASFVAHPPQPVDPTDYKLQETHAVFGHPDINEKTTLYQTSYQKPEATMEKADYQAARSFHTGTHSRITDSGPTEITTYQAEYVPHPGVKPSEPADPLKGGRNVVPHEPRFLVGESLMKRDYKAPPKIDQASVVNNNLQKSHVQLASGGTDWSTTQQDYFRYYTFRMPGEAV